MKVDTASFWEITLLEKKGKLEIDNVYGWINALVNNTNIQIIDANYKDMINSTLLPDFHRDPFDRLLISQALNNRLVLVTKDGRIKKYDVPVYWQWDNRRNTGVRLASFAMYIFSPVNGLVRIGLPVSMGLISVLVVDFTMTPIFILTRTNQRKKGY